jgi:Ca-activated chloride channel homolog
LKRVEDYYELLNIPRNATLEELRQAYRSAALRLHPDHNVNQGDTELFLLVNEAYEILLEPAKREEYDKVLSRQDAELIANSNFQCSIQQSRQNLLKLGEPQVHYLLLDISARPEIAATRPRLNICIMVDRSTSMQGERLDQVRAASIGLLRGLEPGDHASIIAFSDRAEMIVSTEQARELSVARARLSLLQAGGATEIGQGLKMGMAQIRENFSKQGVNHLILLTDGRTYGDDQLCLEIANQASEEGIPINCIGIGSDWNDRLLDEIAARSGGDVVFLDSPGAINQFLERLVERLEHVFASHITLGGQLAQSLDLRSAFRLLPDPMPLSADFPLVLGNLAEDEIIRVLLELVVHPIGTLEKLELAHLTISGNILSSGGETDTLPMMVSSPISAKPDREPPPEDLLSALGYISLYQMQEKARHEAELGEMAAASQRLEKLATQLIASGERELAKAALNEAARLTHTRRFSNHGEKTLKYGTRALLLPPKRTVQ